MKILKLPKKSQGLINDYFSIPIFGQKIVCPYFQNLSQESKGPAYSGKGFPEEIEKLAQKLARKKSRLKTAAPETLRLYLVMSGIGIDCSGFVANVLDTFLKETKGVSLYQIIPLTSFSFFRRIVFKLRPRTNLSAHALTSPPVSKQIDYHDCLPGDMIKFDKSHLAIISKIWKKRSSEITRIEYFHSTSDYSPGFGVRKGLIVIKDPKLSLEQQDWQDPDYNGPNWSKRDYLEAKPKNRGVWQLNYLFHG